MNNFKSLSFCCTSTLSFCLLFAVPTLADQCSFVTGNQALNAQERLEMDREFLAFCELFHDEKPELEVAAQITVEKVDFRDYWQVRVNDRGTDLAYTYVQLEPEGEHINLAAIVACPTINVTEKLILRDKQTIAV